MSTDSILSLEQQANIATFLANRYLPAGLGTEKASCSIASINLALTGRLTAEIPVCMSEVIGKWIIKTQDAMPDDMRNSPEWKQLLPQAAGTGRAFEAERRGIILDWMWSVGLPQSQPFADEYGFGESWREMCEQKTADAAYAAYIDADNCLYEISAPTTVANAVAAAFAIYSLHSVDAANAMPTADFAAYVATFVGFAAAAADSRATFWEHADPCALLAKLIEVSQ